MFQNINIEKELISLKAKNKKSIINSAINQLNNDIIQEKSIQKNIINSNSKNYYADIKIDDFSNVYSYKEIRYYLFH